MSLASDHARTNAATAIHSYAVVALDYDLAHVGRITDLVLAYLDNELARVVPPGMDNVAGVPESAASRVREATPCPEQAPSAPATHLRAPLRSVS